MNEYKFGDVLIGCEECFQVIVSEEMVDLFGKLSGDENPLHIDDDYAKTMGYKERIVYGLLTTSFISRLVGMYLPGKYCLFQKIENLKFIKPVYVGDEITVKGTVEKTNNTSKRAYIRVDMSNQNDENVLKAIVVVSLLK